METARAIDGGHAGATGWQPQDDRLYQEAMAVVTGRVDRPPTRVAGMIEDLGDATAAARYLQGGLLKRLRDGDKWRVMEPDLSFGEFSYKRFGFRRTTADYLIAIFEKAQKLGLTVEKLAEVGWSKMREVLSVANPEDVNDWLEKAKTSTREQLRSEVHARRQQNGGGRQGKVVELTRPWTIYLDADQYAHAEATIEAAMELQPKKAGQMPSRGAAFDAVCASFLALHLDKNRALPWYIKNLRRAFPTHKISVQER